MGMKSIRRGCARRNRPGRSPRDPTICAVTTQVRPGADSCSTMEEDLGAPRRLGARTRLRARGSRWAEEWSRRALAGVAHAATWTIATLATHALLPERYPGSVRLTEAPGNVVGSLQVDSSPHLRLHSRRAASRLAAACPRHERARIGERPRGTLGR